MVGYFWRHLGHRISLGGRPRFFIALPILRKLREICQWFYAKKRPAPVKGSGVLPLQEWPPFVEMADKQEPVTANSIRIGGHGKESTYR